MKVEKENLYCIVLLVFSVLLIAFMVAETPHGSVNTMGFSTFVGPDMRIPDLIGGGG